MLMVWTELSTNETEERMVFMRKLEMEDIFTEKLIFDMGFRQSRGSPSLVNWEIADFYKKVRSFRIETVSPLPHPPSIFLHSLYLEIFHKCIPSEQFEVMYFTYSVSGNVLHL